MPRLVPTGIQLLQSSALHPHGVRWHVGGQPHRLPAEGSQLVAFTSSVNCFQEAVLDTFIYLETLGNYFTLFKKG